MFIFALKNLISFFFKKKEIKREFPRKLSNFNPQWTKTLYQSNLKNTAFFLHFFRPKDVIIVIIKENFSRESEKMKVKFYKNCENTGKYL